MKAPWWWWWALISIGGMWWWAIIDIDGGDMRCTGMNMKVRKMRNKDQVPWEKP